MTQTSRRQKYFIGHSVWWRAIFHRNESKFAGPKSLSEILTNKSEIHVSLVATFLALANTIILRHAVSSLKKLLARFVSLLWQKNLWDVLYAFHFSVVLHSWDPSFRATSFRRVFACIQPPGSYCSCIMYVKENWLKAKVAEFSVARLEFSLLYMLYLSHTFDSLYTLTHKKYQPSSFPTKRPPQSNSI